MTDMTISESAVQTALISQVGMSADLVAAIQACVQNVLAACNTASAAGVPVGVVDSVLGLVGYTVKDTLRVLIEAGMNEDGTPDDPVADALKAQENAAAAALLSVQAAEAAHAAALTAPAPAFPAPPAPSVN